MLATYILLCRRREESVLISIEWEHLKIHPQYTKFIFSSLKLVFMFTDANLCLVNILTTNNDFCPHCKRKPNCDQQVFPSSIWLIHIILTFRAEPKDQTNIMNVSPVNNRSAFEESVYKVSFDFLAVIPRTSNAGLHFANVGPCIILSSSLTRRSCAVLLCIDFIGKDYRNHIKEFSTRANCLLKQCLKCLRTHPWHFFYALDDPSTVHVINDYK